MGDSVYVLLAKLSAQGANRVADLLVAPSFADRNVFALGDFGLAEPLFQGGSGHLSIRHLVVEHPKADASGEGFDPCPRVVSGFFYSLLGCRDGALEGDRLRRL